MKRRSNKKQTPQLTLGILIATVYTIAHNTTDTYLAVNDLLKRGVVTLGS